MALSEPSPLNEEIKFEPAIEQKETTEQEGEIPVSESVSSEKINKDSSEENKPEFI